ncbi:MAG TPA: type VI secretion protein, partial [Pusillimonas sp.]|nr:type VI secretion protein [Pusillimonas sp.]
MSMGDNAGVEGGVVSNTMMGECEFVTASFKVKFEGNPVVRQLDSAKSNKGNTFGALLEPSQVKVNAN